MKKLIITEEQEKKLVKLLQEEQDVQQMPVEKKANKPYCVDPEKMLIAKKKLDQVFRPKNFSTVVGGEPTIIKVGCMIDANGNELKLMYKEDMVDYLINKIQHMFSDAEERDGFAKLAVDKWFENKIGPHGMVDVNQF